MARWSLSRMHRVLPLEGFNIKHVHETLKWVYASDVKVLVCDVAVPSSAVLK